MKIRLTKNYLPFPIACCMKIERMFSLFKPNE